MNRIRPSDKAYVRVWRADPAYELEGEELPDPPPSLALVLGGTQSVSQNRNSKIGDIAGIDSGEMMISGSEDRADRGEGSEGERSRTGESACPTS